MIVMSQQKVPSPSSRLCESHVKLTYMTERELDVQTHEQEAQVFDLCENH